MDVYFQDLSFLQNKIENYKYLQGKRGLKGYQGSDGPDGYKVSIFFT